MNIKKTAAATFHMIPIVNTLHPILLALALVTACSPARAEFTEPAVPDGWTYYHDLEIGNVDGITLRLELVAPDSVQGDALPVIAYIHGGGWNHGNKDDHANRIAGFARRGYIGASIMYRFAPAFSHPAQIEDVQAAIRFLKAHADTYHLDPGRINLWGSSAGAHLASLAGTAANNFTYKTNGLWENMDAAIFSVVDFSGPNSNFLSPKASRSSSLTAFLGAPSSSIPEKAMAAMPITHVDAADPPFFVAHGDADTTVPVSWSRDFVTAIRDVGGQVEYHELEGGTHKLNQTHPETADLAWAFLDRLNSNKHGSVLTGRPQPPPGREQAADDGVDNR